MTSAVSDPTFQQMAGMANPVAMAMTLALYTVAMVTAVWRLALGFLDTDHSADFSSTSRFLLLVVYAKTQLYI